MLFNGRPLTLGEVVASAPAVRGVVPRHRGGHAVADVLFGKVNPGKLPVSFPQSLGQVPIYYNHEPTGRPCDVTQKCNSRYWRPAHLRTRCSPFGFGLSYTTFDVSDPAAESELGAARRQGRRDGEGHQHR